MSFIYSRALVEEYSAVNCSDTDVSVQWSENPMHKPSWWHDKTMEPSRHSRFGMTYAPLTESLGAELLTWFVADSLAKTSALLETGPDWTAKGQDYGHKWQGSLGKYDPVTHSLKTAQLSLLEGSTGCCATLPRWGLMLDGALYQQPIPAPLTSANESGYSQVPDGQSFFHTPNCAGLDGGSNSRKSLAKRQWQTPVADDSVDRKAGKWNSRGEPKLSAEVLIWPTPRASEGKGSVSATACDKAEARGFSPNLPELVAKVSAAKMWPTATAYKGWAPNHNRANTDDRLDYSVERLTFHPGQPTPPMRLNPEWVEWLMGWPIGHTALKPLATDRLAEWRQQHSPSWLNK